MARGLAENPFIGLEVEPPTDRIYRMQRVRPPRLEEQVPLGPVPPFNWYDLPSGGMGYMTHHEQSETVQNDKGEWVNVYGRGTRKAGQRLPDTPVYPTLEEAVEAAKRRSKEHDKR